MVYIARSNSPRLVSIGFHAGARAPAHTVATGTVILSTFGDEALLRWVAKHEFAVFTPEGVIGAERFLEGVYAARALGYWIADQQLNMGLRGIAVPLKDRKGDCKGAVGMTLQIQGMTREQTVARLLPLLQETAQLLRPLL
jgi:IclR family transcriptional regulator, pca regulon regulatory protein